MTLGTVWQRYAHLGRFWILGVMCAEVPDVDTIGFWMGVPYGHVFGHRGLTHSLFFAGMFSAAVVAVVFRNGPWGPERLSLWLYFFASTSSHAVSDALTNGGLGVAFFAPFDNTRYFFPFRPIVVSPLDWQGFLSPRGLSVLQSELLWIVMPCAAFIGALWIWRSQRQAVAPAPVPDAINAEPDETWRRFQGRDNPRKDGGV